MPHARNLLLAGVSAGLGLLTTVSTCRAAVRITEVMPRPSSGLEWVEIYNDNAQEISLADYTLWDQLSSPDEIIQLDSAFTLEGHTFAIIEIPSAQLNNSADGVELRDASGTTIVQMSYNGSELDESWQLGADGWIQAAPSRGQPTLITKHTVTPVTQPYSDHSITHQLLIAAIDACPIEDQEGIYIENPSDESVAISQWLISDANNSKEVISDNLSPSSTTKLSWDKNLLNNSGDSLFISTSSGQELFSASYQTCQSGELLIYSDDKWQPTSLATNQTQYDLVAAPSKPPSPPASPPLATSSSTAAQADAPPQPTPDPQLISHLQQQRNLSFYPLSETLPHLYQVDDKPSSKLAAMSRDPSYISIAPRTGRSLACLSAILVGILLAGACGYDIYDQYKKTQPATASVW